MEGGVFVAAHGGDGGVFDGGGGVVVCCHADVLPFCRCVCGYGCDAKRVWSGLISITLGKYRMQDGVRETYNEQEKKKAPAPKE